MKLQKIILYLIDFDNDGKDILTVIEQNRYTHVFKSSYEEVDIGEWDDDNPLNQNNCPIEEYEKYFRK